MNIADIEGTVLNAVGTIITDDSLVFYHDGKEYVANGDNINFPKMKAALLEKDYKRAIKLLNPRAVLAELGENTKLALVDDQLMYKDEDVHPEIEQRIVKALQNGHDDLKPILKLLENIYQNPSKNSRNQMYSFIIHRGMPILEDGTFVGYKGVSEDYKDKHSGDWENHIGKTNKMPRRDCDDNPDNHCSQGFHVGSKEYADSWAGRSGHLMAVSWNPKNAVAVPNDHNCEKLRVCEYTVIAEVTERSVYFDGDMYELDEDGLNKIQGEGIIEQRFSDNFYKIRSCIETAREDGDELLNAKFLKEKYPVSDEEWDTVLEEQECEEYGDKIHIPVLQEF